MLTITRSNTESELNWTNQISAGGFTSDDLINAYLKGIQDHAKQAKKDIEKQFTNNLLKAQNFGSDFIESMRLKGIVIKYARLKFTSIDSFKLLFFVPKKFFLSENASELYDELTSALLKVNSDKFQLTFNIMPNSKRLNERRILADGYIFTYGKQQ